MIQKVLKVGTSVAVVIPKKSLKELGIKAGDSVSVNVDEVKKTILIKSLSALSKREERISKLTLDFIDRYRKDLENLADK